MNDISIAALAKQFAIVAHGDQKYGDEPYVNHLQEVRDIAWSVTSDFNVLALAWLHDVQEDTKVTNKEIRESFGDLIADCCNLVSDEPGKNRKERKLLTNYKMHLVDATDPRRIALIVKACDRLANVRRRSKNDMYKSEHAGFILAAYRPGLCDRIWMELGYILGENK